MNFGKIKDFISKNFDDELRDTLPYKQMVKDIDSLPNKKTRFAIFSFATLSGGAISIASIRPLSTGHIISNNVGAPQSLLGLFLFVFGLVGLTFSLKKNKK